MPNSLPKILQLKSVEKQFKKLCVLTLAKAPNGVLD